MVVQAPELVQNPSQQSAHGSAKVQEAGRQPAGPPWEEYHWIDLNRFETDAAAWGDPSIWRVRLVQPLV